MDYFVYIIQSEKSGEFYKGYTSYPVLRLEEHNNGQTITLISIPLDFIHSVWLE